MMDEKMNSGSSKVCMGGICDHNCSSCGSCGGGACGSSMGWTNACGSQCINGRGHYALRWLLGLIILGIVFSMGVMFGQIHERLDQDRDYTLLRNPGMSSQTYLLRQGTMLEGSGTADQPVTDQYFQ